MYSVTPSVGAWSHRNCAGVVEARGGRRGTRLEAQDTFALCVRYVGKCQSASLRIHLVADVNAQIRSNRNDTDTSNIMAETVRLLVNSGADVTALDINHSTPLHMEPLHAVPEAMGILIEHGADVNAQNETNLTPLHKASLIGNAEAVQLLIKHGADVTSKNWNDDTPLHFALSWASTLPHPRSR